MRESSPESRTVRSTRPSTNRERERHQHDTNQENGRRIRGRRKKPTGGDDERQEEEERERKREVGGEWREPGR